MRECEIVNERLYTSVNERLCVSVRLCAQTWLGRHPAKKEITRSSGGHCTTPFFFAKIMIFLGF
jgi:hypothetical protein